MIENPEMTAEYTRRRREGRTENEAVYLAGKITGDPEYKSKFYSAARELEAAGFVVLNPAILPSEGFAYEAYMRMSTAMLDESAAMCFLPDWTESRGAMYEYGRAVAQGKRIFMFDEWKAARGGDGGDAET